MTHQRSNFPRISSEKKYSLLSNLLPGRRKVYPRRGDILKVNFLIMVLKRHKKIFCQTIQINYVVRNIVMFMIKYWRAT